MRRTVQLHDLRREEQDERLSMAVTNAAFTFANRTNSAHLCPKSHPVSGVLPEPQFSSVASDDFFLGKAGPVGEGVINQNERSVAHPGNAGENRARLESRAETG